MQFDHILEDKRKTEEKFWSEFYALKPKIIGGMFDCLSATLRIKPTLQLPQLPRLADYATYGTAAAIALGYSPESYLLAFHENVKNQNQSAIETSSIAQVVIEFMQDKNDWSGSSSDLYSLLKPLAENAKLEIGGKDGFPKSLNKLWTVLKPVRTNLMSIGITATHSRSSSHAVISLTKTSKSSKAEDEQPEAVSEYVNSIEVENDFSEPEVQVMQDMQTENLPPDGENEVEL